MKKLELKNLKVKALSKDEKGNVNGGRMPRTSGPCNIASSWPVECTVTFGWRCGGGN